MMKKQDILRKIGGIISELQEQHDYLSQADKINILELELFTANADFLIDHIEILKKLNDKPSTDLPPANYVAPVSNVPAMPEPEILKTESQIAGENIANDQEDDVPAFESSVEADMEDPEEQETIEEPVVAENETAWAAPVQEEEEEEEEELVPAFKFDFTEEPKDMTFDFEKKIAVEEVFDRALSIDEQKVIEDKRDPEVTEESESTNVAAEIIREPSAPEPEPQAAQPEAKIEVFQPSAAVTPPPADAGIPAAKQEAPKPKSLNEILSERAAAKEAPSGGNFSRPVSDLKTAVSLNDKMIFIKELFNGYNLAYSEAIEILNRFDSFEAADNFLLKNYAEKNNWVAKQEIVDRFYEILKRKFNKL